MGRTITAVITTFIFQMVNVFPLTAQVTADSSSGVGGGRELWCTKNSELGDLISNPFSQEHLAV